jgi:hypothetical protein
MALKWVYQLQLISLMFSFELDKMVVSKSDVALLVPLKKVLDSFKIFPLIEYAANVQSVSEKNSLREMFLIIIFFISLFSFLYLGLRAFLKVTGSTLGIS